MNYLFDTNIILTYGRSADIANQIEKEKRFFDGSNNIAVSVVTLGEIDSLTKQFNYGDKRKNILKKILEDVFVIDINIQQIIERYGEIDAYSQGKLSTKKSMFSSRNMGKNDLWIAATASVYDMELITADKDFNHLQGEYLNLQLINLQDYKK